MTFPARVDHFKIGFGRNRCFANRLPETWPSGAAVEFMLRGPKRGAAANTMIKAIAFFIIMIPVGEGPLGAFLYTDPKLFRRQNIPPFIIQEGLKGINS